MRQWPIDKMKIDEKTALVLEGGIADSIPVEYASRQGYENIVVVLTRNRGYRKKEGCNPLMKLFYRKYPALQKAIAGRNAEYNRTMELIERMEDGERYGQAVRPI